MKITLALVSAVAAQEWQEQKICAIESTDDYLAYDLKLIQDPGLYVGLLEQEDCANFCNSKRQALGVDEQTTCCLQAKYWYQWYDLWAADCALIDATATEDNEDEWKAEEGLYTTFQAFITEPNVAYDLPEASNTSLTVPDKYSNSSPSDWRKNMKWNDGKFCNVDDPWTDALVMNNSTDINNRQKCFDYCSENRIEFKGTCCGLIFQNSPGGDSNITCGLYFAELEEKTIQPFDGGFYYYTAIPLGDSLRAKIEDIQELIEDTRDDWLGGAGARLTMAAASVLIIGAYV